MRLAGLNSEEPPIWEKYNFVSQLTGSWPFFLFIVSALSVLYILELVEFKKEKIYTILFWATAFGLPAVIVYPLGSPDAFGNAAFAHLHAFYGLNPYQTAVACVSDYLKDPFLKNSITGTGVSPYGPLWTWLSYGLYRTFAGGGLIPLLLVFKFLGLLIHLCITAFVYYLADEVNHGNGARAAVLYGFNPLAIFELIANAHNDGLGILLLLFSVFLFVKGKRFFWPITLGLAAAAKITTLLVVPLIMWKLLKSKSIIHTFFSASLMLTVLFIAYLPFLSGGDPFYGLKNISGGIYTNTLPIILFNLGFEQMPVSIYIANIIIFISSYAYFLKKVGNGNNNTLFIGMGLSFITYFLTVATAVHQWYYLWPLTLIILAPASIWSKLIEYQTLLLLLSYITKIIFWPDSTIYGPYTYLLSLAPVIALLIINYRYILNNFKKELFALKL